MNYSELEEIDSSRIWTPYNIKNGRINIIDEDSIKYKKKNPTIIQKPIISDSTSTISQSITNNELSDLYFSKLDAVEENYRIALNFETSEDYIAKKYFNIK
jgi:hypothetical protein